MDGTTWLVFVDLARQVASGRKDTYHVIEQAGMPTVYPFAFHCQLADPTTKAHDHDEWKGDRLHVHEDTDCTFCKHLYRYFPREWRLDNLKPEKEHLHAFVLKFNKENDINKLIQEGLVGQTWRDALEPFFDLGQYSDRELNQLNATGISYSQEALWNLTYINDINVPNFWADSDGAWTESIRIPDDNDPFYDPFCEPPHPLSGFNFAPFHLKGVDRCHSGCPEYRRVFHQRLLELEDHTDTDEQPSSTTYGWGSPRDDMSNLGAPNEVSDAWSSDSDLVDLSAVVENRNPNSRPKSPAPSFDLFMPTPRVSDFSRPTFLPFHDCPEFEADETKSSADLSDDKQWDPTVNDKCNMVDWGRKNKDGVEKDLENQMAIFIHAGAGYHSLQNERVHLAMCSRAAIAGMKELKAGQTSVEAVEAAIKVLENDEITNAGFGSNLSIDGKVEGDATIVDHFGRSGACGAVPHIRNPISLAKAILDSTSETLSLRRVPPNFLVGDGAKLFATEHGIHTVTNDKLTSRNAKDRWRKWSADLSKARDEANTTGQMTPPVDSSPAPRAARILARKPEPREHATALLTGTWNEGQPDSPSSDRNLSPPGTDTTASGAKPKKRSPLSGFQNSTQRSGAAGDSDNSESSSPAKRVKTQKDRWTRPAQGGKAWTPKGKSTGDVAGLDGTSAQSDQIDMSVPPPDKLRSCKRRAVTELTAEPNDADFDLITDTMGAIAIDQWGDIAAGSSSGGIGMKHKGRTGPAALVGVGTAVIPYDENDPETKTVAAVTSGTGEHMATTMAASKCAERLYHGTRRGPTGHDVTEEDTTKIMRSFIDNDFMGHPGVRHQASARAIGIMAVEATEDGVYVNWAHNTDSFALASFGSADKTPHTVMSRLPEGVPVTIGARKLANVPPEPMW